MIRVDVFLDRVPSKRYNCLHFVRDVWVDAFAEDVSSKMAKLVEDFSRRGELLRNPGSFVRLSKPESPCFVLMQRMKCTPHIGIYLDGNVLHLADHGAEFQPLSVAKGYFQTIRFYK